MARLLYARDVNNALLLLAVDEEGECVRYKLSHDLYAELGSPGKGAELSEEAVAIIKDYDLRHRAKKKALSLLSYSDKNEAELKRRLVMAGYSMEVSEDTAREMVGLGYVNEEEQLRRLILTEANVKLRGPMKIFPYLQGKGYSRERARLVMSELVESGEVNFKENAKKLLDKRLPRSCDLEEKKKLLYKNGYKI